MEVNKKRNKLLKMGMMIGAIALAACTTKENTSFQYDNYADNGYSTGMRYSYPGEVNWGSRCAANSVPVAHGGYGNDLAMSSPMINGYGSNGSYFGGYGMGGCGASGYSAPMEATVNKCTQMYPEPEFPASLREMCISQGAGIGSGMYGKPPVPTSPSREYAQKYPGAIDYYNQSSNTMPGNAATGVTPSFEPMDDWMAPEGASLRSLLQDWADKSGWRVIWNTDREYILEAGAMFRGRYSDVSAALIRAFARATPAPMGVFYKGNKVLVVHTQEAENAD